MKRSEFLRLSLLTLVASQTIGFSRQPGIFDDKPEHYYHVFQVSEAALMDKTMFASLYEKELLKAKKHSTKLQLVDKLIGYTNDDFITGLFTVVLKFKK